MFSCVSGDDLTISHHISSGDDLTSDEDVSHDRDDTTTRDAAWASGHHRIKMVGEVKPGGLGTR